MEVAVTDRACVKVLSIFNLLSANTTEFAAFSSLHSQIQVKDSGSDFPYYTAFIIEEADILIYLCVLTPLYSASTS
jgi:hypothetical protein